MGGEGLRAGDLVEVRSAEEILAGLDSEARLDSLPFMPEMLRHCGRRFRVVKRADKVCDTSHRTGSRRLPETVMLEGLRCDGTAHGGCQAECLLFWKEQWLRKVSPEEGPARVPPPPPAQVLERLERGATSEVEQDGRRERVYRCQGTELHDASVHLRTWDPRPYLGELTSGNVPLPRFLEVCVRAAVREPLHKLKLLPDGPVRGTRKPGTPPEPALGLAPGDWVRVRSKEEIATTLDAKGMNRGLWFDREMVPFCGKIYRVRSRVNRIIDERSGRMLQMKSDCVTLENVICRGEYSTARWFCPRAIFPFWRECWLQRAAPGAVSP
jgi:hypothetical protein